MNFAHFSEILCLNQHLGVEDMNMKIDVLAINGSEQIFFDGIPIDIIKRMLRKKNQSMKV